MLSLTTDFDTWCRIVAAAVSRNVPVEDIIPEILKKGLGNIEKVLPKNSKVENVVKVSKVTKNKEFIRENWLKMGDAEMASALGLSRLTVSAYRRNMGLFHAKGPKKAEPTEGGEASNRNLIVARELTEEDKKFIEDNKNLRNSDIAQKLNVMAKLVSNYKRHLLVEYFKTDKKDEPVTTTAVKYGVSQTFVSKIRVSLGLLRPVKRSGFDNIGTRDEIISVLTKGGKTLPELFKSAGITLTRQRVYQLLTSRYSIDLNDIRDQRTAEWYARRAVGNDEELVKKLLDRTYLESRLAVLTIQALTAELHVPEKFLCKYLKERLGIEVRLILKDARYTELVCGNPNCGRKFFRRTQYVRSDRKRNPGKLDYCGRECFGLYAGNTSGFGGHPENVRKSIETRRSKKSSKGSP